MRTIVKARHVEDSGKAIVKHTRYLVHATRNRACGVFTMTNVAQEGGHLIAFGRTLRGHFIAYTPHHDRRVVAIVAYHIDHIAFGPLVEVTVVTIITLGDVPFVKRLKHHHKAHFVT